eukprot:5680651-Alexandrium_andersonii.AAC.1
MSASLVGSEMCIRDRFWRPPGAAGGSGADHLPIGVPAGPARCSAMWGSNCLLYTSDAADDM